MLRVEKNDEQNMYGGVFFNHEEMVSYYLMKEILEYDGPVGAWTLKELLDNKGKHYSSATIGRYLKMLDNNEFTMPESNKGRVVTEKGAEWVREKMEQLARAEMHSEVSQAIKVNEYTDLVDLMKARKAIEVSAVKYAAKQRTKEELLMLHKSTNTYYRYVSEQKDPIDPALDFHSLVVNMSHNKYIINLFEILVFEEKQMESQIEELSTRKRGAEYVIQHDYITAAIEEGDSELAGKLMENHIDQIIKDLELQINEIELKEEKVVDVFVEEEKET